MTLCAVPCRNNCRHRSLLGRAINNSVAQLRLEPTTEQTRPHASSYLPLMPRAGLLRARRRSAIYLVFNVWPMAPSSASPLMLCITPPTGQVPGASVPKRLHGPSARAEPPGPCQGGLHDNGCIVSLQKTLSCRPRSHGKRSVDAPRRCTPGVAPPRVSNLPGLSLTCVKAHNATRRLAAHAVHHSTVERSTDKHRELQAL